MIQPPTPDPAALRVAIDQMLSSWDVTPSIEVRKKDGNKILVMYGLGQSCHRATRAALVLCDAGLKSDTAPLVRQAFECAITVQWLHKKKKIGLDAFTYESNRQYRNRIRSMKEAKWEVPKDLLKAADESITAKPEDAEVAGNLHAICRQMQMNSLYAIYRQLCSLTHPSLSTVSRYVDFDRSELIRDSEGFHMAGDLWLLAASVLWCGRIFDEYVMHKPRKRELKQISRELNIPVFLIN